jgi:hypothetical protein
VDDVKETAMTRAVRPLLILAAVAATLAACNRDRETAEAPPAAPAAVPPGATPADAAAPLTFAGKTAFASVSLTLPEAIKAQPDLHARVYAQEVAALRAFAEGAQADRTEAGGTEGLPPFEQTVTVAPALETGKLLSLRRTAFDWSGGAHPNTVAAGILWDKALKRQIGPAELFARGADLAPLDQALCAAVNAAKRDRVPDAQPVQLGGKDFACPRAADTPFVLAASSTPGRAGGLLFLIGPYQVGPYAEGPYEVVVPQSVFRALLAPAYAEEFAGGPPKSDRPAKL